MDIFWESPLITKEDLILNEMRFRIEKYEGVQVGYGNPRFNRTRKVKGFLVIDLSDEYSRFFETKREARLWIEENDKEE